MSDEHEDIDLDRLEREYFHLQEEIQSFDSKALTIKAWSVSVAGAIAGSSALAGNRTVLLFAALVSFMFWFIEASWKSFQYANYKRVNEIESFMRGSRQDIELWQISKTWKRLLSSRPLYAPVQVAALAPRRGATWGDGRNSGAVLLLPAGWWLIGFRSEHL